MGARPRYRKYYSDDLDKDLSSIEILLYILAVLLAISVANNLIKWMKVKPEPKVVPIVKISQPVTESVRPMNLTMGTAIVKEIRENWYKVYFSVLNRDEKVFTGFIHSKITEGGQVTQTGVYPCSIAPGEERLVTYFTSVKPDYVSVKIEDMGLGFGARFKEEER